MTVSTYITIQEVAEIDLEGHKPSIAAINSTIGWSKYDAAIFRYMLASPENALVAKAADGKIIGYSILIEKEAEIPYLAVHAEAHGNGIGGLLLEKTIEKAAAVGLKALSWDFRGNNVRLGMFYKNFLDKKGYEYEETTRGIYLNGDPKLSIRVNLESSRK